MLEKKQKEIFTIFDSDEVDTLDSFITETDNSDCKFERIDLDKFSQEYKQINKTPRPSEIGNMYKREITSNPKGILEPREFIEELQSLTSRTEKTIEILKSLQSKCSLGIVDLEHKIEFEVLDQEEGQEILNILRKMTIYQRNIKESLEKFKAISEITQLINKTFTDTQIEKLEKVEEFQASKMYSPRILNIVERKTFPKNKLSIKAIDQDLTQLIDSINSKYEKV